MACPACGSERPPIIYGIPTEEQQEAAARGEVQLAACGLPHYPTCKKCGNRIDAPQENALQQVIGKIRKMV